MGALADSSKWKDEPDFATILAALMPPPHFCIR